MEFKCSITACKEDSRVEPLVSQVCSGYGVLVPLNEYPYMATSMHTASLSRSKRLN